MSVIAGRICVQIPGIAALRSTAARLMRNGMLCLGSLASFRSPGLGAAHGRIPFAQFDTGGPVGPALGPDEAGLL